MQQGDVTIHLESGKHLELIVANLKKVGADELAKELKQKLRLAAKPLVPLVRAAIAQIPADPNTKRTAARPVGTLRKELSAATKLQMRTTRSMAGINIRVDGRKMPDRAGSVPAYMEGKKPNWRHPVFGNQNVWTNQAEASHEYFYKTVEPVGEDIKKEIDAVVTSIANKLRQG